MEGAQKQKQEQKDHDDLSKKISKKEGDMNMHLKLTTLLKSLETVSWTFNGEEPQNKIPNIWRQFEDNLARMRAEMHETARKFSNDRWGELVKSAKASRCDSGESAAWEKMSAVTGRKSSWFFPASVDILPAATTSNITMFVEMRNYCRACCKHMDGMVTTAVMLQKHIEGQAFSMVAKKHAVMAEASDMAIAIMQVI